MELYKLRELLRNIVHISNYKTRLPGGVTCLTSNFRSDFTIPSLNSAKTNYFIADMVLGETGENENSAFKYFVFLPGDKEKYVNCTILLHGLNERSWEKYLLWAHYLASRTGNPVILFPLAFHVNRSPKTWSCPRLMSSLSDYRKQCHPLVEKSSLANAALSLRMETAPELFPFSGIQSYFDVVKLTREIKRGELEMFKENCSVNFFAYSIGALLTQILLLSNPSGLFTNSRAYLFCGGASFDKVNGVSRSIMDSIANGSLKRYFLNNHDITSRLHLNDEQSALFKPAWKFFQFMIKPGVDPGLPEHSPGIFPVRFMATGLLNDEVIPGKTIEQTLNSPVFGECSEVEIMDFPFPYSHQKPFPFGNTANNQIVDEYFRLVFNRAANFLS